MRQLPKRQSRGKNRHLQERMTLFSTEKKRSNKASSQFKNPKFRQSNSNESSQKSKIQLSKANKVKFQYTRGIHYFFNLNLLDRVSGSVSYVNISGLADSELTANQERKYSINYRKTDFSGELNRKYIGLPQEKSISCKQLHCSIDQDFSQNISMSPKQELFLKSKSKNSCLGYLFENEDKRHNFDRQLIQLRFVLNNIGKYLSEQQMQNNYPLLRKFSTIEKDNGLRRLFQADFTFQEKQRLLKEKVTVLQDKRLPIMDMLCKSDQLYYKGSLDLKISNNVKALQQKLSRFNLYSQIQQAVENEHNKSSDCYFKVQDLHMNSEVLMNTVKILSLRAFKQGQNLFYSVRAMLLKLFDLKYEIEVQNNFENLGPAKYLIHHNKIIGQYKYYLKKLKKQESDKDSHEIPTSSLFNESESYMESDSPNLLKSTDYKTCSVNFKQCYFLQLFYRLYGVMNELKGFIDSKKSKQKLGLLNFFCSYHFEKVEHEFLLASQNPNLGLLSTVLQKILDLGSQKENSEKMNCTFLHQFDKIKLSSKILCQPKEQQIDLESKECGNFCRKRSFCKAEDTQGLYGEKKVKTEG